MRSGCKAFLSLLLSLLIITPAQMLTQLAGVHVEPLCQSNDLVIVNIDVVIDLHTQKLL